MRIKSLQDIQSIGNSRLQKQVYDEYKALHQAEAEKLAQTAPKTAILPFDEPCQGYNLVLPFPPSVNMMFPTGKNGRRYLSDRGKIFKREVWTILEQLKLPSLSGALKVELKLYRPRKSGDWDNYNKAIFDALKKTDRKGAVVCRWGIIEDDSQIEEGHIYLLVDKTNPRVELTISQLAK